MVDLSCVTIFFQPYAIEYQDIRIGSKETLQVKGHLLFGSPTRLGQLVFRLERIQLLNNHVSTCMCR